MSQLQSQEKTSSKIFVLTPSELAHADEPVELSPSFSEIERYELPAQMSGAIVYFLALFLAAGLIWGAIAKVDIVAEAPGQIIPQGNVKLIQPVADGVIEQIFVKEGDQVKLGDKLVLLDRTPYAAELNRQTRELEIANTELEQHTQAADALNAIIAHPDTLPPAQVEISNISDVINGLYTANSTLREASHDVSNIKQNDGKTSFAMVSIQQRFNELTSERADREQALKERLAEYKAKEKANTLDLAAKQREVQDSRIQLKKLNSLLEKTRQQEVAYKTVFEQGAMSRVDYLQIAKHREELELDILRHQSKIADLTHHVELAKSTITQFHSEARANLAQQEAELKRLSAEIATVQLQMRDTGRHYSLTQSAYDAALQRAQAALEKEQAEIILKQRRVDQATSAFKLAEHVFEQAELKAPIEGTVTGLTLRGKGQVVSKQERLMTVVPTNCMLIVEARLPNKDMGLIQKGQDAKLKLDAFPFQDFGIIAGKVSEIEAYPQEDPRTGSFYKVRIIPDHPWIIARGRKVPFASGMSLKAEIVTRKRTILNILLEPIKNMQETRWN